MVRPILRVSEENEPFFEIDETRNLCLFDREAITPLHLRRFVLAVSENEREQQVVAPRAIERLLSSLPHRIKKFP